MGPNLIISYDQNRYKVQTTNLNDVEFIFIPPVIDCIKDVKTLGEDKFYSHRDALQTHVDAAVARRFMPSNDDLTIANKALNFENDVLDDLQNVSKGITTYKNLQQDLTTAKATKNIALIGSILRVALCIGIIAAIALGAFFVWSSGIILSPFILALMAGVGAFILVGFLMGAFIGTKENRNFFQQLAAGFKGTKPLEKLIAKTTDNLRLSIERTIPFFKQIDNVTGKSHYETLIKKLDVIKSFYQNNLNLGQHESRYAGGVFKAYPDMVKVKQKSDEYNQVAIDLLTMTKDHINQYNDFLNAVFAAHIGAEAEDDLLV